ncbi:hypothetical protein ACFL01_00855 [Planctomycetota bacterium]
MADEKYEPEIVEEPREAQPLDIEKAIAKSTSQTTIADLAKKGIKRVKVLNEKAIKQFVEDAVQRILATKTSLMTEDEREKIFKESRAELNRLLKEHTATKEKADLAEQSKNELIQQVESLQKQMSLMRKVQGENMKNEFERGRESQQQLVEELYKRIETLEEQAKTHSRDDEARGELQSKLDRLSGIDENIAGRLEGMFEKMAENIDKKLSTVRVRGGGGAPMTDYDVSSVPLEKLFQEQLESNLREIGAERQQQKSTMSGALAKLRSMRGGEDEAEEAAEVEEAPEASEKREKTDRGALDKLKKFRGE